MNLKEKQVRAFATIDAAKTVSDGRLPMLKKLYTLATLRSVNGSANPVGFLMDLLSNVGGKDVLIRKMAQFISLELPAIEIAIKGIMLTNLKKFISCSINPFLTEEIIRDGIAFDLSAIDISGTLITSPLDKRIGKYFYFGCDNMTKLEDVEKSLDFNAFLWAVINTADRRMIWNNRIKKSKRKTPKPKDEEAIITVEFVPTSNVLKDANWRETHLQVPFNNIVHVMIGDTVSKTNDNIKNNRYRKKTIVQFNYDYINSIKLFDSKVVAAQLIDRLTNCLYVDFSLSLNQQIIKSEVKKIMDNIVETDDSSVSDCFFTFSNDDYNSMVEEYDLIQAGLGIPDSTNQISAEDLLSSLDGISEAASKEEVISIIEGSLFEVSKTISTLDEKEKTGINASIQMNFIDNMISELTNVIVTSMLSPKLYLLLAINNKLSGIPGSPDMKNFIAMAKTMLIEVARMIRDLIIRYLFEYLSELLKPIISQYAIQMTLESTRQYVELMSLLLKLYKSTKRRNENWTMDDVDYADILQTESVPNNNEC